MAQLSKQIGALRVVRTDAPWGDDVQIMLPGEPPREGYVVEAIGDHGGMVTSFWPDAAGWQGRGGIATGSVWTWAGIVTTAITEGWRLFLRKKGPKPTPEQLAAVGIAPYRGQEDDGEQD